MIKDAVKLKSATKADKDLLAKLEQEAGTQVSLCYQCGKCSAGCPASFAMDYPPREIIRLLQLDMVEEALNANSIWVCATCETCSERCPRGVDIASLMDTLRREALRQGKKGDNQVAAFNAAFLNTVKMFGRTYEAGILLQHNLATMQPFKDAGLGLPMVKRGKISILPERIKGRDQMKKIFARVQEQREEK
ncbi:MAG: 4Fe-4S dicluster domain-containing protein [Syntrophomonadaceae bacterium]|jgi:heterodisulfide reductase subunit C|nr:4Fe-4S dicluster domain-containing protein [Syntrophomonadaceae bacterium]